MALAQITSVLISTYMRFYRVLGEAIQAQKGRSLLWYPLFLSLGIVCYFKLPFEPRLSLLCLVLFLIIIAWRLLEKFRPRHSFGFLLMVLALVSSGLVLSKLRTMSVQAPIINASRSTYYIEGIILDVVTTQSQSPKVLVAPIRLSGLRAQDTPIRLRLGIRPEAYQALNLKPGDVISGLAIINPPAGPSYPQGYDYARKVYFQGIGGVGFMPGTPIITPSVKTGLRLRLITWLNHLRWALTSNIVEKISKYHPNDTLIAGFGAALVTGHQAYLDTDFVTSMRNSGLAHILSISGVHMAIVGGFLFFTLRAIMALIPFIALNWPIKKIAAGLSILGITLYLAISGSPAPAVRAAIVGWVAFSAIIFDRQAMSLRALSIAALLIIVMMPEAVLEPGFQMSFAATCALLALSESLKPQIPAISLPGWLKTVQGFAKGLKLTFLSSLVASLSTTPFGLAYFNRVPVYGLFANLFEAPITTFWIMPSLAIGSLGISTPVGEWALYLSHSGLALIAKIAAFTSHLPNAVITHASSSPMALGISGFGVFWVCLFKGWGRWIGLIASSSILWWPQGMLPTYWIDPYGANAGFIANSSAFPLRANVKQYGYETWRQHIDLPRVELAQDNPYYDCHSFACVPKSKDSQYSVGFWFGNKAPKVEIMSRLCSNSTLVVIRGDITDWPKECNAVNRLTKSDFQAYGAIELTRSVQNNQQVWKIRDSQSHRGNRPWTSIVTEDSLSEMSQ